MERRYRVKVSELARVMSRAADAAEGKRLGHACLVAHLAYQLGRTEGLSDEDSQILVLDGLFHDLGWILVAPEAARLVGGSESDALRLHPWGGQPGTADFRALVAEHALIGPAFLAPLGLPPAVAEDIGMSHEAWDGGGVPDGLAGGQITDRALILSVADHAVSRLDEFIGQADVPAARIEELQEHADRELDPELVSVARDWLVAEGAWEDLGSFERFEAVLDDALYPLFGDFLDVLSPVADQWTDLIGQLADRFHPLVPEHSSRVKSLGGSIAREMGLTPEEVREVELAACLAEIGRVGLPSPLVFRLGAFTEDERELLRAYPTIGERILEPIKHAAPIFQAAVMHREKLNGSGYPQGLRGEEIPLGGRIICVADAFVALTADSSERPGYSSSLALSILQSESTKLFDGLVVDALEAIVSPTRHLG